MKTIKIIFLLACFNLYGQKKNANSLKFEGQVKGIFEITEIDTSQSENKIKLRLKYSLNSKDFDSSKLYYGIVISKKAKIRAKQKSQESEKLVIGREYYFDLHHLFFYKSLYPGPNTIPYTYSLDGKHPAPARILSCGTKIICKEYKKENPSCAKCSCCANVSDFAPATISHKENTPRSRRVPYKKLRKRL